MHGPVGSLFLHAALTPCWNLRRKWSSRTAWACLASRAARGDSPVKSGWEFPRRQRAGRHPALAAARKWKRVKLCGTPYRIRIPLSVQYPCEPTLRSGLDYSSLPSLFLSIPQCPLLLPPIATVPPQVCVPSIAENLGALGLSSRGCGPPPPLARSSVGEDLPCAEVGAVSQRGSTPPQPHRLS